MASTSRESLLDGREAGRWSASEAALVERWHYRFMARTFGSEIAMESWGRLATTAGIADLEWNHVSRIEWSAAETDERLDAVAAAMRARARTPAVVVTPWTAPAGLARGLADAGWQPAFEHLWSFFDLAREIPVQPVDGYAYTRVSTSAEMDEFIDLFVAVYDEDGQLAAGYGPALRQSLTQPGVRHHLIRHRGVPVAIGTLLVDGVRSQIFNMVVHAEHRRQGLAEWLLNERLAEARAAGALALTALSDNQRIDRWLNQRGFEPGWFSVGFAFESGD